MLRGKPQRLRRKAGPPPVRWVKQRGSPDDAAPVGRRRAPAGRARGPVGPTPLGPRPEMARQTRMVPFQPAPEWCSAARLTWNQALPKPNSDPPGRKPDYRQGLPEQRRRYQRISGLTPEPGQWRPGQWPPVGPSGGHRPGEPRPGHPHPRQQQRPPPLAKEAAEWRAPLPGPPAVLAAVLATRSPQRKPRRGNLPERPL